MQVTWLKAVNEVVLLYIPSIQDGDEVVIFKGTRPRIAYKVNEFQIVFWKCLTLSTVCPLYIQCCK